MTNDEIKALVAAEMSEYYEGAYADSSCARDQLERFARFCIAQGLEMGAERCRGESVEADVTGAPEDRAYNLAIEHCQTALRDMAAEMLK